MPTWVGRDHPPEDDAMPEDWTCCPQHDLWHSPDGWCPACYDDAAREAKAEGEIVHGRVARAWRRDD